MKKETGRIFAITYGLPREIETAGKTPAEIVAAIYSATPRTTRETLAAIRTVETETGESLESLPGLALLARHGISAAGLLDYAKKPLYNDLITTRRKR